MMRRALLLARRGLGQVSPNPMVGAVIARDNDVVGEGFHERYGEAHAEVNALRAAGDRARGASLYVTLEPCNHHGRTPPCTDAIIEAGISRVVYAVDDPNPVASGGADRLRATGVRVESGVLAADAAELNAPFLFQARGAKRPFVTLKLALSIDGALVDASRKRAWLTGKESRETVHMLRASVDAVAVGIGTALADDPQLTARGKIQPREQPRRIVFDRNARLPLDSALVRTAGEIPLTIVTDGSAPDREGRLLVRGVTIVQAPALHRALMVLREEGVRHLLVEGGAGLASALMAEGLVDRLIIFQAPVILGAGALAAFAHLPGSGVEQATRFRVISRMELGADLMTTYAVSTE